MEYQKLLWRISFWSSALANMRKQPLVASCCTVYDCTSGGVFFKRNVSFTLICHLVRYIHAGRIQLLICECEFWGSEHKGRIWCDHVAVHIQWEWLSLSVIQHIVFLCFVQLYSHYGPFFYQISLSLTLHCPYPYQFVALQPTQ